MGQPGDWRQPTGDPDRPFSDIIQAHWVSLTKDNSLVGRISTIDPEQLELQPAESLQVAFVQNGMVMSTGTTDQAGRFSATDLRPRVYSLIAPGANGFMAYSLSVLPFRANGQDEVQRDGPPRRAVGDLGDDAYIPVDLRRVESSLTIDAAAVPPTFKTIGRLVRIYYPNFRKSAFGENAYQNAVNRDRANKLPGWNDEAGPHGRLDMKTALVSKTKAAKSAAIRTYRIPLRPDGRLIGRLHAIQRDTGRPKMVRSLNVFIIQNDRELAQVSVDRYGVFEVNGVSPGRIRWLRLARTVLVRSDFNWPNPRKGCSPAAINRACSDTSWLAPVLGSGWHFASNCCRLGHRFPSGRHPFVFRLSTTSSIPRWRCGRMI